MTARTLMMAVCAWVFVLAAPAAAQDYGLPGSDVLTSVWRPSDVQLGVHVVPITPELRRHFGASPKAGVLVGRVNPGSIAANAGVTVGDLIVRIDTKGPRIRRNRDSCPRIHEVTGPLESIPRGWTFTIWLGAFRYPYGQPLKTPCTQYFDCYPLTRPLGANRPVEG